MTNSQLTSLVAPMYAHPDGVVRADPPSVAVLGPVVRSGSPATPPDDVLGQIADLGGDYPGLLRRLAEFIRDSSLEPDWDLWKPGLVMALAPTLPDETRGLIGTFGADRVCRVFLVASKRDAREVLRAVARLSASSADNGALAVAMFERSLLEETSTVPVLELDAAPAAWLVGWYSLYRRETGNIR